MNGAACPVGTPPDEGLVDLQVWWETHRPGEDRVVSARVWLDNPRVPDEPVDRALLWYLETEGRYNPLLEWARTLDPAPRREVRAWIARDCRLLDNTLSAHRWYQVYQYLTAVDTGALKDAMLHPFYTSRACQEGAYAEAPEDFVALWRGPGREHKPLPNQG